MFGTVQRLGYEMKISLNLHNYFLFNFRFTLTIFYHSNSVSQHSVWETYWVCALNTVFCSGSVLQLLQLLVNAFFPRKSTSSQ